MMEKYNTLESSVRDTFASVVWSHKIQEKQAEIYSEKHKRMELAKIFVASVTSAGILSVIFFDQKWLKIATAFVSFVSIFINSYYKSFDLQNLILQHKSSANSLLRVRDELKVLLLEIHLQVESVEELSNRFKQLVRQLDDVYDSAPNTTEKAVGLARIALNVTKDNSFADTEIDQNLPYELRKVRTKE